MSALGPSRIARSKPGPRIFLAAVFAMLFVACVLAMTRDVGQRRVAADLALAQGLGRRQPAVVETVSVLEESGDAATIVAEALLEEWESTPASPKAPATRKVQELLLEAVARRPGSARDRLLLGRSASPDGSARLWARPLELSATAAPGLDAPATALADKYLTAWPTLPPGDRPRAEATVRRAFRSTDFLRSRVIAWVGVLGAETAVRLLPGDAEALRAASEILRSSGDGRTADLVEARLAGLRPVGAPRPATP